MIRRRRIIVGEGEVMVTFCCFLCCFLCWHDIAYEEDSYINALHWNGQFAL